jgi:hypothetical protein
MVLVQSRLRSLKKTMNRSLLLFGVHSESMALIGSVAANSDKWQKAKDRQRSEYR